MINKILITGANGMLGTAIYNYLNPKYDILATDIKLDETYLEFLDVRNYQQCQTKIKRVKPDIVLHLAALTNLEECESNISNAYATNSMGVQNIIDACRSINIPMVYISTAGVFDGKKEMYTEDDIPNPINVYGKTKLLGEEAMKRYPKHFICRAGWMFGSGKKDKKFVSYMLQQIKDGAERLQVVDDTYGTLTYTEDFAKNLESLFLTENYGLYHMTCSGVARRYDIAKHIVNQIAPHVKITKVNSNFFKTQFPVDRAPRECLENKHLKDIGLYQMRSWQDALTSYLEKTK